MLLLFFFNNEQQPYIWSRFHMHLSSYLCFYKVFLSTPSCPANMHMFVQPIIPGDVAQSIGAGAKGALFPSSVAPLGNASSHQQNDERRQRRYTLQLSSLGW